MNNNEILQLAAKDMLVRQFGITLVAWSLATWEKMVADTVEMISNLNTDTFFEILNRYK